ncbi:hypothetical protein MSUIS_05770 [Mycoplasma suis KI3806]|uniref:Uncharacterized protein n=1 Tax=Mycoplasma suis (strain KI_3806) TaxID=708248 RepID=F0V1Y9_MYCS3|nr:hypothetical protein [Mycoplasma suis]CBZ40670.1 hypothetical protein MSUIS_05770 [Mycoplasma suis KI3806]
MAFWAKGLLFFSLIGSAGAAGSYVFFKKPPKAIPKTLEELEKICSEENQEEGNQEDCAICFWNDLM